MDKHDEFENRKPIEPIDGQMCYDELLVPIKEEEEPKEDNSIADGQLDFWTAEKLPTIEKKEATEIETQNEKENKEQEKQE